MSENEDEKGVVPPELLASLKQFPAIIEFRSGTHKEWGVFPDPEYDIQLKEDSKKFWVATLSHHGEVIVKYRNKIKGKCYRTINDWSCRLEMTFLDRYANLQRISDIAIPTRKGQGVIG